jgi:hypothetical protein
MGSYVGRYREMCVRVRPSSSDEMFSDKSQQQDQIPALAI